MSLLGCVFGKKGFTQAAWTYISLGSVNKGLHSNK